jgi:putative ABC transport system permease protein
MEVSFPAATYPEEADLVGRLPTIEERLRREPGVAAVGASSVLPLTSIFSDVNTQVEGMPELPPEKSSVQFQRVTPATFDALGIPVRAGRVFDERDHSEAGRTVVVNEAFVTTYLGGKEPLGRRVKLGGADDAPWRSIVGVVGSVHHGELGGEREPQMYLPFAQAPARRMQLVVETTGDPSALVPNVKTALRQLDPGMAVLRVRTGEDIIGGQLAMPRFLVLLVGSFAALAMALALVGIYGVMAFLVAQRRREIGVRLALGARPREVLGMVVRQGLTLTAVGLAAGIATTLALARGLSGLLYGVEPADPWTLGGAAIALLVAGLLACIGPALRASHVHPAVTLRGD